VLHGVVRAGIWSDGAAKVRDRTDSVGMPGFVVEEFRKFLRCGVPGVGCLGPRARVLSIRVERRARRIRYWSSVK
jgi:hypothetical protein